MIIDRYVVNTAAASSFGVSVFLVAIFAVYSMARFLTEAASGMLRLHEVFRLTLLKSLVALEVLLPVGLYFGLIIALGRLHAHLEITAFHACGVSDRRLHRPLVRFSLLLAVLVGLLSTHVRPWAYGEIYKLQAQAEASSELERIRSGQFHSFNGTDRTIFIERSSEGGRQLHGVFVRSSKGDDLDVITAPRGSLASYVAPDRHRLILEQAHVFREDAKGRDVSGYFDTLTVFLAARVPESIAHRSKAKETLALRDAVEPKDIAEFQWRLTTPVSTLLLALLALRMGHGHPREGRFAHLPLALGMYAVYYNLTGIARSWVEQQSASNLWWPPVLLAVVLSIWSILSHKGQWRWV
ncbi:MAG: LPS export ABC transporter permease LptF [Pseudomonadota bacterium]